MSNLEYRWLTDEEFQPLFDASLPLAFEDSVSFEMSRLWSEEEKATNKRLREQQGPRFRLNLGVFEGANFIAWSWGYQQTWEIFNMTNSAVMPGYRRRGIYSKMLTMMLERVLKEGFQKITSRHNASNNGVLIAKLKAGFLMTGMEISDTFGTLVLLTYFSNPVRRQLMNFRTGEVVLPKPLEDKLKTWR